MGQRQIDQEGNLAVEAVLLQQGTDNQLVHELWNNLPPQKDKEEVPKNIQIDVGGLLPAGKGYSLIRREIFSMKDLTFISISSASSCVYTP
jgi:hypothetical protein